MATCSLCEESGVVSYVCLAHSLLGSSCHIATLQVVGYLFSEWQMFQK